MFMGEKFGRDSIWENHLAREIWVTGVELRAVLEEQTVPLSDILRLEVGSTLRLSAGIDPRVSLRCGQVAMAHGRIGRSGDRLVVKVEDVVERDGSRA
jgi:flagellar motor switch protein FliM